jgi:hypothetical protein
LGSKREQKQNPLRSDFHLFTAFKNLLDSLKNAAYFLIKCKQVAKINELVMVTGKLCNNMKNIFFQNKTIELIVV